MTTRRALVLLPGAALLSRCGPPPPPPPAVVTVLIEAGADQNPAGGGAAPVSIKLYQLTTAARFDRADYFALSGNEKAALGQDLAQSDELVVTPGEKKELVLEMKRDVKVLGVIAQFRDIDSARWRTSAPVPSTGPLRLKLATKRLEVTLLPA